MKRLSYVAKPLIENADGNETFASTISEAKWNEIRRKEENDMFILGIREEIVENCLDLSYKNYLSRQVVSFTVHCAYLAWVKAIGVYSMFRDPGDSDDPKTMESWEPDEEPEPSVIDSWASQCIKPAKPQTVRKEKGKSVEESVLTSPGPVTESKSTIFQTYNEGEGELYYPNSFSESNTHQPLRERSIFSRTLSMSKESLPLVEFMGANECRTLQVHKKKKGDMFKS